MGSKPYVARCPRVNHPETPVATSSLESPLFLAFAFPTGLVDKEGLLSDSSDAADRANSVNFSRRSANSSVISWSYFKDQPGGKSLVLASSRGHQAVEFEHWSLHPGGINSSTSLSDQSEETKSELEWDFRFDFRSIGNRQLELNCSSWRRGTNFSHDLGMEGSGFRIPYRTELTGLTIRGCSKRGWWRWWQREVDRLLIGLGGRRKTHSGSKPSLYATQSVGDFVNLLIGIAEEWLHLGLGEGIPNLGVQTGNQSLFFLGWNRLNLILRSGDLRCLKLKILIDRNGQRIFSRDFQSKSLGLCCRHLTSPLGRAKVIQFYTKESEAPSTSTPRTWACRDKNQLSVQRRVIHFFPANRTKPWEITAGERSCRFHYPSMKWVLPVAFSLGFYLCTFFVDPFS